MRYKKIKCVLLSSVLLQGTLFAKEEQNQLNTIIVEDKELPSLKSEIEKTNKTSLDSKTIESFPKGNGNITELLKFLPDVTVENNAETSLNGGELTPEDISISGGRFYQNNFQIDGVSNNSLLDPANNNIRAINDVKGNTQEIFLDTDLIKSIDVYDSDVPARYGNFTGGVIDVKTKHAQGDFSGKIKYRYTSDSLTKFFVDNEDDFEASNNSADAQPKFTKQSFGFTINTPINENEAIYFNTSLKRSKIPLQNFFKPKSEKRNADNYFVKYSKYLEDGAIFDLSFIYSPYEENRFLPDVRNSDYKIKGGGFKSKAQYEKEFDSFKLDSVLDFSFSENSRETPQHFYNWGSNSTNTPWGSEVLSEVSKEGGYGDISKEQMMLSFKNDFDFDFLQTGFELKTGRANKTREEESSIYKLEPNASNDAPQTGIVNLLCFGADGCIDGDQYASSKNTYHASKGTANILSSSAYIEKNFEVKRLNFRVGARYDFNNYMANHDIAYRSLSSLDVFNDRQTVFNVGLNRYYGSSFLTYKLKESDIPYITYTRGTPGVGPNVIPEAWSEAARTGNNKNRYSDLKTPYSDEKSLSLNQRLWGGNFNIKWVERESKNGFAKTYGDYESDGYRYYELSNEGRSTHESIRLTYSKNFGNHGFSVNFSKSKTKRTNATYNDAILDDIESTTPVSFNGETVDLGTLPKKHDTEPKIIKLTYRYALDNFRFHTYLKYKSAYQKLEKTSKTTGHLNTNPETGDTTFDDIYIYDIIKYDPIVKVDLSMAYDIPLRKKEKLTLKTDIKNVFNKKEEVTGNTKKYYMGRQFWFEVAYKF